jgi:hypothetical protein
LNLNAEFLRNLRNDVLHASSWAACPGAATGQKTEAAEFAIPTQGAQSGLLRHFLPKTLDPYHKRIQAPIFGPCFGAILDSPKINPI